MNLHPPSFACVASLLLSLLAVAPALAASSMVKLVIDMRAQISSGRFDPRTAAVGVRGSTAPLSWSASVMASDADGDGRYTITLRFEQAGARHDELAFASRIEAMLRFLYARPAPTQR